MQHIDYQYLRPKKATALKQWCDFPVEIIDRPAIWNGQNATILPLRPDSSLLFGRGGVVDCSGSYVELSSIPNRVQFSYPFENAIYKDEKIVYCGYLVNHWGHFLIEAVTRLWYFMEQDLSIDKYVFFLNENEERTIKGNYRKFFELLKIWDKIEIINQPTTYREIIVPELGIHCRKGYTPKLLRLFDEIANNVIIDSSWTAPKKIYFSRSQLKKGAPYEFGFDTLDNFFKKNGYTILYPENVPLDQMIYYIRNSDVVATLSGSLPHNMLFANQGQKVEIVERLAMNNDNQTDVNKMRELNVTYIDAHIPLYTVDFVGPIIMAYTEELQRFATNNGYLAPDSQFLTEKHLKKCFVNYMKAYKDLYRYHWFMFDWYAPFVEIQTEGYNVGLRYFGDYIHGKKPFLWHHYFEFHYFKQFLKRLLKSLR